MRLFTPCVKLSNRASTEAIDEHWIRAGVAVCGLLGLGALSAAHAQSATPSAKPLAPQRRWQDALDAFAAEDRKRPPVAVGVLFVGSSSIRLWRTLQAQFAGVPVIQRGFGGSRLADCAERVQQLVVPYRPRPSCSCPMRCTSMPRAVRCGIPRSPQRWTARRAARRSSARLMPATAYSAANVVVQQGGSAEHRGRGGSAVVQPCLRPFLPPRFPGRGGAGPFHRNYPTRSS